jgi:phage terminase large subunit
LQEVNLLKQTANARRLEPWQVAWMRSRNDPYLFVTGVMGVLPFGADNPNNLPQCEHWQELVLKTLPNHDRISVRSGHGVGKGALLSWLVLWGLLTHEDIKVPIAANSQNQLRDNNWPEINKWAKRLPEPLRSQIEILKERVQVKVAPESAFAVARTATKEKPEALQGLRGTHTLYLIDEASGIDDIIFEVAQGSLSAPGAKALLFSNPTRASGFFYDTHHKLRARWKTFVVNSEDVPRARGHIEDIIAAYGKGSNKYRVRVLGEFPTADDETVIPLEWMEASRFRDILIPNVYPVWGVDVARFGDDSSALCKRKGNSLLEPIREWQGKDNVQLAGLIKAEFEAEHPDRRPKEILVDVIGVGSGVVDILYHQGLPVTGVNVGEAPSANDKYMRLRDELWFKAREWFQKRDVVFNDEATIAELAGPRYDFHMNGRIVVESKKEMKKRGVRSPNRADAFILTLAAGLDRPVQPPKRWGGDRQRRTGWAA